MKQNKSCLRVGNNYVCVCVCFAGPLGAALCNAYDARRVVMTGGCLAGLGLILASQATCLAHLYLTMGVISGNQSFTVHIRINGIFLIPQTQPD